MDIAEEDRADLASALERNIGRREAQTLMAHLPEGGAANLATKDDLSALSEELRADIARCATKDDLQRFLTREEFSEFRSTTFADFRSATHEQFHEVRADLRELKGEVRELRKEAEEAIGVGDKLRAEWRHDLVTYIGRQTTIQLASWLAIVIAAFTYAAAVTP